MASVPGLALAREVVDLERARLAYEVARRFLLLSALFASERSRSAAMRGFSGAAAAASSAAASSSADAFASERERTRARQRVGSSRSLQALRARGRPHGARAFL